MLINIIDNSLKFTPTGGEICISGKKTDVMQKGFYVITVSDTGCEYLKKKSVLLKKSFIEVNKIRVIKEPVWVLLFVMNSSNCMAYYGNNE